QRLQPGKVGHQQVQKQDVGPSLPDKFGSHLPIFRFTHDLETAGDVQNGTHCLPHDGVVVGDQHSRHVRSLGTLHESHFSCVLVGTCVSSMRLRSRRTSPAITVMSGTDS